MSEPPPSSEYQQVNGDSEDSEAPTQLWVSPFKHLAQFPTRRAARRRERLEALLKGQEVTNTAMPSSTNLTGATATHAGETHTAATHATVASDDVYSNIGLPERPPPPESIPTGTYASVRPVAGPRLAVFVALGVAMGGLAALQLNRVLSPTEVALANAAPANAAPVNAALVVAAAPVPLPQAPPPSREFSPPVQVDNSVQACALVPPLQVDLVATRPQGKLARSVGHEGTAASRTTVSRGDINPLLEPVDAVGAGQTSCSRNADVNIPTQLHPRINPLMTSSQVFTEQGASRTSQRTRSRP